MSIRTIEYTVNAQGISPADVQSAGLQGEDRATDLVFCLSQTFYDALVAECPSAQLRFRVDTQDGAGGFHASEHLQVDSELQVVYSLPKEITLQGGVSRSFLVISALEESNSVERVVYSFPALLHFAATPQGSAAQTAYQKDLTGLVAEVAEDRALAAQYADDARYAAENAKSSAEDASWMLNEVNALDVPQLARQTKTYASQAAGNKDLAEEYAKQAQKQALAAQSSFNGAADFAGQAAATLREIREVEQAYAATVKGRKKGTSLRIENAEQNPLDLSLNVRVDSKNILNFHQFSFKQNTTSYGASFEDNGDGSVTLFGTATGNYTLELLSEGNCPFLAGKTYVMSRLNNAPAGLSIVVLYRIKGESGSRSFSAGTPFIWSEHYEFRSVYLVATKDTVLNGLTVYPQIEEGTVPTAYTPFVEDFGTIEIQFYDDDGCDTYLLYPNADGTIPNAPTCYPQTNIFSTNDGVIVTAVYSQNFGRAVEELRQAIERLGGSV